MRREKPRGAAEARKDGRPSRAAPAKLEGFDVTGRAFRAQRPAAAPEECGAAREEYIQALQDHVKILEYELRLLKEREHQQSEEDGRSRRFFADGVPLNGNILSLKTQYRRAAESAAQELARRAQEIAAAENAEGGQRARVAELAARRREALAVGEEERELAEEEQREQRAALRETREARAVDEAELQQVLLAIRERAAHNTALFRAMDKEARTAGARAEAARAELASAAAAGGAAEEAAQQVRERARESAREMAALHDALGAAEAALAHAEREIGMHEAKVREVAVTLEAHARDRERDWAERCALLRQLDAARRRLEGEQRLPEAALLERVAEAEALRVLRLKDELLLAREERQLKLEEQRRLEARIEREALEREKCQERAAELRAEESQLQAALHGETQRFLAMSREAEALGAHETQLQEQQRVLAQQQKDALASIERLRPAVAAEEQQLKELHKQIDLAAELRGLNLADAAITGSASSSVNATLRAFIDRVEGIQRRFC